MSRHRRAIVAACAMLAPFAALPAQCESVWEPGFGTPGVAGQVNALVWWDADGAGPRTGQLVVAGEFSLAGPVATKGVAAYEPGKGEWTAMPVGSGPFRVTVHCVAVAPSGDLFAGASIYTGEYAFDGRLLWWSGTAWIPVSPAFPGATIRSVLVQTNGTVWLGGDFWTALGHPGNNLLRWNGAWSTVDFGLDGVVNDLAELPNGDLVAVGGFTHAGTVLAPHVARWNGSQWSAFGVGTWPGTDGWIRAVATLANGDVVVTGAFYQTAGLYTGPAARWNGSAWTAMGSPPFSVGNDLHVDAAGRVLACSQGGGMVHRWDGGAWSTLGHGNMSGTGTATHVFAVHTLPDDSIVAGGWFAYIDQTVARNLARRGQGAWHRLADGFDGAVYAVTAHPDGGFVAGGPFQIPARGIAHWDGTQWLELGTGTDWGVFELATMQDGDVVASGYFTQIGGVPALHVARWDGAAWHALGSGVGTSQALNPIATLCPLANGDLVAGGSFTIAGGLPASRLARWDGATWSEIPGIDATVVDVVECRNGDLLVGGYFTTAGGQVVNGIARWNGTTWSSLGSGTDWAVFSIAELANGDVVVGGNFSAAGGLPAQRVARWNGAAWSPMGAGLTFLPMEIVTLSDGDLLAVGRSTGAQHIARWDGAAWQYFGSGEDGYLEDAAFLPGGTLVVGGAMSIVDGHPAAGVARLATTCPPDVVSYGAGCAGSAGVVTLAARTAPWFESTFRARATGLPPNALAVGVFAFTQISVPLAAAHPLGLPGCSVLVADEILIELLVGPGSVDSAIRIPPDSTLVGNAFYHQVVPVELTAAGDISALSSSNGLRLTVGIF